MAESAFPFGQPPADRKLQDWDLPDTHLERDGWEHTTIPEATGRNVEYLLMLIQDLRDRVLELEAERERGSCQR